MRAIRFRAWDVERKSWLNETDTYAQAEKQARYNPEVFGKYILSQFTGLRDAKGTEIWEMDKVTDGINPPFIVTWDYSLLSRLTEIKVEVIGNVYE